MAFDKVKSEHSRLEDQNKRGLTENVVREGEGLPIVKIISCGGAGNNALNRLYRLDSLKAELIAFDIDKLHLDVIKADKKIHAGRSLRFPFGSHPLPEIGMRAALQSEATIKEVLAGSDLVIVLAGMGGTTGSGGACVIAHAAKEQGALVIAIAGMPFKVEKRMLPHAQHGLDELVKAADTTVVIDNNQLLEMVPELPLEQCFGVNDQLVAETVQGIVEELTVPSLIDLNFSDLKAIFGKGGIAGMLICEVSCKKKPGEIVEIAFDHPLSHMDYRKGTGALIQITGGPEMKAKEAEDISVEIRGRLSPKASVICSAHKSDDFADKIRIYVTVTGVENAYMQPPEGKTK